MDAVGLLLLRHLIAEGDQLRLDGDVGDMGGDLGALGLAVGLDQPDGLGHGLGRDVAHGDVAALGGELTGQLPSHAGSTSGDDGCLACEVFHGVASLGLFWETLAGFPTVRQARRAQTSVL